MLNQTLTRPEFYRLPRPGVADPYFGFSRSFYYSAERRGWLQLIRIRDKDKEKGVTLVPYKAVVALVRTHARREKEAAQKISAGASGNKQTNNQQ